MEDPTRIPRVLDELRATWEGQPNLSLPTLFGILANRGVAWGTTDHELIDALQAEAARHPADLPRNSDGHVSGHYLVTTTNPEMRVTCTPGFVVVRAARQHNRRQPGVWPYSSIRPTGPGRLLVLTDDEGIEHKLGVVSLITALNDEAPRLDGLKREDRGNCQWLVITDDGRRHIISQVITAWGAQRRHVDTTTQAWEHMLSCEVGKPWMVRNQQGDTVHLGTIVHIVLLEA
ncbi:hypothetical protein [Corynebacterium cystitidis]|uniref:hypothetical protein n=1 Tax=Corynebacterium cystitidis TaxID=35757 RepID=UPI00211E946F|nr:hypothetical protein [Corynebacterium cystitidis]